MTIPAFAINLKSRPERKVHIEKEFKGQTGFATHIVEATEHPKGAIGLWKSIIKIITKANNDNLAYIVLCEDDHCFTEHYNYKLLQQSVNEAQEKKADLLCGGVSWFKTGIQVSEHLFWVEKFSGLQFAIIFKKFYQRILDVENFTEHDAADYTLSALTDKKFVIHPYISIQKDFGYSDVTLRNNLKGRVEQLFADSSERFELLRSIKNHYSGIKPIISHLNENEAENIDISFSTIIEKDNIQEKWKALCNCVEQAQLNNDDFIVIGFDPIISGTSIKKADLLNNMIAANNYGCEVLLGNIEMFNHAVPVTNKLFWIDSFSHASFIVLFSTIFDKIITTMPADEKSIYNYLSYLTSHKLAIYPFITAGRFTDVMNSGFQEKGEQLSVYKQVYQKYCMP